MGIGDGTFLLLRCIANGFAEVAPDTDELRRRYLLRRFWQTAAGFWEKRGHRIAWVLTITLFIIILLNIAASWERLAELEEQLTQPPSI